MIRLDPLLVNVFPVIKDMDANNYKLSSPFYSSPYVIKFFAILLDNYINDEMPISDFNDTSIHYLTKIKIITDIFPDLSDNDLIVNLFNIVDIMFKTIRITFEKLNTGILNFNNTCQIKGTDNTVQNFKLDFVLNNNIELLFYTLFYTSFSNKLKLELKKALNISNLEESILNRCNNKIFENVSLSTFDENIDINICKPVKVSVVDPEELIKKSCGKYISNLTNIFAKKSIYTNIETPLAMLAFLQIFIQLRSNK